MRYFRIGWMGAMTDEVAVWCADRSEGARSILVPFSGSGRAITAMSQTNPGAIIRSFDMQVYCDAFMRGILAASDMETNVDRIRLSKGKMYEERYLKGMPDECAGFFDWVANHGTLYDKAILGSVTIRTTMVGRMTHWSEGRTVYSYYKSFELARERFREWIGLNINIVHTLGSFYDYTPVRGEHYDLIQIDPPKVTSSTDVYSQGGFAAMDRAFGGSGIMVWRKEDVIERMQRLMEIDADRYLFFYTTGVRPTPDEMKRILKPYGTIKEEQEFIHSGRSDIGWLIER
jgi:hypothetical protein